MPPAAPSSAVSPSHNSLEPLDPNQPALPRQPNPHSNRGTPARPISAVSSLGGSRTPAAERAAPSLKRPASATLIHEQTWPFIRSPRRGGRSSVASVSKLRAARRQLSRQRRIQEMRAVEDQKQRE